jgi:hypothetical protein
MNSTTTHTVVKARNFKFFSNFPHSLSLPVKSITILQFYIFNLFFSSLLSFLSWHHHYFLLYLFLCNFIPFKSFIHTAAEVNIWKCTSSYDTPLPRIFQGILFALGWNPNAFAWPPQMPLLYLVKFRTHCSSPPIYFCVGTGVCFFSNSCVLSFTHPKVFWDVLLS